MPQRFFPIPAQHACSTLEDVFGGIKTSYIRKIWNSQASESTNDAPIEESCATTWRAEECVPPLNVDPKINESRFVAGRAATQSVDRWGSERHMVTGLSQLG